jgi:hypothetical protein
MKKRAKKSNYVIIVHNEDGSSRIVEGRKRQPAKTGTKPARRRKSA